MNRSAADDDVRPRLSCPRRPGRHFTPSVQSLECRQPLSGYRAAVPHQGVAAPQASHVLDTKARPHTAVAVHHPHHAHVPTAPAHRKAGVASLSPAHVVKHAPAVKPKAPPLSPRPPAPVPPKAPTATASAPVTPAPTAPTAPTPPAAPPVSGPAAPASAGTVTQSGSQTSDSPAAPTGASSPASPALAPPASGPAGLGTATASQPLKPILGSAISPPHYPSATPQDYMQYFQEAAQVGSSVRLEVQWGSLPSDQDVANLIRLAKADSLKFTLTIDPLTKDRTAPSVPAGVGGTGFGSPEVQAAFTKQALAYAALKPDLLGLGVEVNFLALADTAELNDYIKMVTNTYQAIKARYPDQKVEVGFQYDLMKLDPTEFGLLSKFNGACDSFSFTTYPKQIFGTPGNIPADYYLSLSDQMRGLGLTKPVGFSEIGWDAATPAEEAGQNEFFRRLPGLMMGLNPQYLDLALVNDTVGVFLPSHSYLNDVGLRYNDGTPKAALATVEALSTTAPGRIN